MPRTILTFDTLFQVLAADKVLREHLPCRPTPTPPGLSTAICGVSIEILDPEQTATAIALLRDNNLSPAGVHNVP